jgi:agmatinase
MWSCSIFVLCASSVVAASLQVDAQQQIVSESTRARSFIERSIFGPRSNVGLSERYDIQYEHLREEFLTTMDPGNPMVFSGSDGFAHLPRVDCLSPEASSAFDIAIVGAPFDLGVSYRPGARFGPPAARLSATRFNPTMGYRCVLDTLQGIDNMWG